MNAQATLAAAVTAASPILALEVAGMRLDATQMAARLGARSTMESELLDQVYEARLEYQRLLIEVTGSDADTISRRLG